MSLRMLGISVFCLTVFAAAQVLPAQVPPPIPPKDVPAVPDDPKPADPKADEPKSDDPPAEIIRPSGDNPNKRAVTLHLMEGSVVSGDLSVNSITVTTEFGKLEIPVTKIVSLTPGLDSHPKERERIRILIAQLGAKDAKQRDEAQRALSEIGLSIRSELEKYRDDEDAERRTRVEKILVELEELAEEQAEEGVEQTTLIDEDTVETTMFTVVGEISPKTFQVKTKFGLLTVNLNDLRRVERETSEKPEVRKSLTVEGQNLVQFNMKSGGIRVSRGDKVSVRADGTVVMSPWGSNASSSPDGDQRYQWYVPGKIATGTLCGRIGTSGKIFKIGSKHTFTATRSGVLYFGMAMNPSYANQGYQFPGQYNVKLRVNPQD